MVGSIMSFTQSSSQKIVLLNRFFCDSALSAIFPGEIGVPGLRGPQGYQGPQGDTGESGLKGSETPVDVFGDVGDPGKPGMSYCCEKITLTPGANSISYIPSKQHQTDHPSILQ